MTKAAKPTSTTNPLTAAQRSELRGKAHHLDPVVMIGDAGLTPAVMAEVERALSAHELIKIRVLGDDRDARLEMLAQICTQTASAPVQTIGKLLIVWRKAPDPLTVGKSPTAIARKAKAIKAKENRAKAVKVRRKMARSKIAKKAPAKRWFAPGKARGSDDESGSADPAQRPSRELGSGQRDESRPVARPRRVTRTAR
jgi:RNA-binding protein